MKVLFVYSGNDKPSGVGTVVKMQAEAIQRMNVSVSFFPVLGKGVLGYLNSSRKLSNHLKKNDYDIIHAHYSLSGIATTLAFPKTPLVVSLMGSDVRMKPFWRFLIRLFSKFFWADTIVKSLEMQTKLNLSDSYVIPNGVDLSLFEEIEKSIAKKAVNFNDHNLHVVFVSNPERDEKNFSLSSKAVAKTNASKPISLHAIFNKPHREIITHLYASDVLILTSRWEGSPNIIKEAMAANCPIVSTDVGDVRWLLGNEPGHFIADPTVDSVSEKLTKALMFAEKMQRTQARERLISLELDNNTIANRIINVYKKHVA